MKIKITCLLLIPVYIYNLDFICGKIFPGLSFRKCIFLNEKLYYLNFINYFFRILKDKNIKMYFGRKAKEMRKRTIY